MKMQTERFNPDNPVHCALRAINNVHGYGDITAVDMPTDALPGHVVINRPYMGDALRRFRLSQDGRGYLVSFCARTRRVR